MDAARRARLQAHCPRHDPRRATGLTVSTSVDGTRTTATTLAGNEPTEIITGTGIGASTADQVPLMLMRRKAKETAFVWTVALDGEPVTLETLGARDADGQPLSAAAATALTVRSGMRCWRLLVNPDKQSVQVSLSQGS